MIRAAVHGPGRRIADGSRDFIRLPERFPGAIHINVVLEPVSRVRIPQPGVCQSLEDQEFDAAGIHCAGKFRVGADDAGVAQGVAVGTGFEQPAGLFGNCVRTPRGQCERYMVGVGQGKKLLPAIG